MFDPMTLDIETAPVKGFPQEYALQPWRYNEGKAKIDCISIGRAGGQALIVTNQAQFRALLKAFAGKELYTWRGTFDVAWLIAYGYEKECRNIIWRDAMILWKWLDNSQLCERRPAWSLADGVKRFFKDEKWCQPFIAMKKAEVHAGENDKYWETRAKLDCIMTSRVAIAVHKKLDTQRFNSAMITMSGIVPVAKSWLTGVMINYDLIDGITPALTEEMAEIEMRLGCHNHGANAHLHIGINGWQPSKVLRSPKQLAELLYVAWGLTCKTYTDPTKTKPHGSPSTSKAALTYLADDSDLVLEILRWRELNTQLTKYIQSPLKAREYLGCDVVHPSPSMFSTYTGRYTYSSKTQKKFATGVALHQWPRKKEFRALIQPRPGYKHAEFDAAGQESRLMAEVSGDANMRNVFVNNMDFHSFTGSKVSGLSYEAFMKGKAEGNSAITGDHGFRYQGKFTNLSCIAEGQLVDTDRGPVPIQDVTILDKVWDGCDYVSHDGVAYMGYKEIISCDGIIATPDHKVMTASGWKEFKEVIDGEISRSNPRYEREVVWEVDHYIEQLAQKIIELTCGLYMRVWGAAPSKLEQLAPWKDFCVSQLFEIIRPELQRDSKSIPCSEGQVRKSGESRISQLWRAWNSDDVLVRERILRVYSDALVSTIIQRFGVRPHRQLQALRTGQFEACIETIKSSQSSSNTDSGVPWDAYSLRSLVGLVKDGLRGVLICEASRIEALTTGKDTRTYLRTAHDTSPEKSKARVYDIINAGPRHRFTVQGRIVSNCNYRIGVKTLRRQARVQYGMNVDFFKAKSWQDSFQQSFPGVKTYWGTAIAESKATSCAVTMAGRRFGLMFWDKENKWSTESSAINFPIQGAGADMKDLAIQEIDKYFPEFEFWFDLHDGLHYQVPIDMPDSRLIECREMLNNMDYKKWWGVAPTVPLTWDASVGANWAKLKELGTTYWALDECGSIGICKTQDELYELMDSGGHAALIREIDLDEYLHLHREGWTS